jgi:hypothetical protein
MPFSRVILKMNQYELNLQMGMCVSNFIRTCSGTQNLLKWLYSPMWTFASLMDFSQSSPIDLTVPRPLLRFPNCWPFLGWGPRPHAQPPTWRTRSPYLYPLETGWPSYNTPRHRVPILVAFYDMHGLQRDYSFPQSPHGDSKYVCKIVSRPVGKVSCKVNEIYIL